MFFISFFTEILRFLNKIFPTTPRKQIQKVVNIYDWMHYVLNNTKVQRFVIKKAHNGGGLIHPTTPLYITAIYEDYSHPLKPVKDDYQRLQIDEEYIRMILDLCRNKVVRLKTKDIKSSVLKTLEEGQGVKFVEFRYLYQDRHSIYFCSLVTAEEGESFDTPLQQSSIALAINGIRNNIS